MNLTAMDTFENETTVKVNATNACDAECKETLKLWGFWIEGIAIPCIALFGIFGLVWIRRGRKCVLFLAGNIACVFVFNHKSVDLKPSFSNILKCLSIYDMGLLVRSFSVQTLLLPLLIQNFTSYATAKSGSRNIAFIFTYTKVITNNSFFSLKGPCQIRKFFDML